MPTISSLTEKCIWHSNLTLMQEIKETKKVRIFGTTQINTDTDKNQTPRAAFICKYPVLK